ncbi:GNAT family N-acetyltransferase [Paraflavitalea sp. CAU 1676]|uniref:GNAT family N-acetyltransferase n=1 Tax=Paraflavitalea sp. CAU 1676 TaxID=3032598 RepID=UPI0023DC35CF|nr:GNAT family N-acetyltransferase [Paraflavitalea sp. CAU 1676]MDF2188153.1 GNAT family N-acetyltransferase [Paraflavitalea sp. CAU 1676]
MYTATTVSTDQELEQILQLQRKNLKQFISQEEKDAQGFLTIPFDLPMLQKLHAIAPSIIIKHGGEVVAYAMTVLLESRAEYALLEAMFASFERLQWKGKPLHDYRFYVMGQVCVSKEHRGKGLFDMLYQHHKEVYSPRFDFIITEISTSNYRSIQAHNRVGFETVHTYTDSTDTWNMVIWDWR